MKHIIHATLFLLLCPLNISFANTIVEADILGIWVNQAGDGLIEISQKQGLYTGTIIGSTDGNDRLDANNPDPALQTRSLQDVVVLGEFSYQAHNQWQNGWVYDPNNGKTYRCNMTLIDSATLKIRGYIGIPLFGRTETWTKQQNNP